MKCENLFCIYFSDDECILDAPELDILGNCKNCTYIKSEKELKKKREEQLYRRY